MSVFTKDLHLKLSGWEIQQYDFALLSKTTTKFNQLSLIQIEYDQIPVSVWKNIGPHLRILTFRFCLKMRLQDFHKILQSCKIIEHIQVYDHFPPLGPGYHFKTFIEFDWPIQKIKRFEMIRASAVDNLKLEEFLMKMSKLEYLRVESASFSRMEEVIFRVISERSRTLRSVFLVDNKDGAGADNTLVTLTSLCTNNFNGYVAQLNHMELQFSQGPELIHFGCRLNNVVMTPVLQEFLRCYTKIRVFDVWTDEAVLEPQFLFDMFGYAEYLKSIVVHCDQYDKTFTRPEVMLYQRRKLKKIVFFPD